MTEDRGDSPVSVIPGGATAVEFRSVPTWPGEAVSCGSCAAVGVPFAAEDGGYRFPLHVRVGAALAGCVTRDSCPGSYMAVEPGERDRL